MTTTLETMEARITTIERKLSTYMILVQRITACEEQVAAIVRSGGSREVPEEDTGLGTILRAWRRETAEAEGIKPFHVFGDRVLAAIATIKPCDKYELAKIKGMGDQKVEKYGTAINAICLEYLDSPEYLAAAIDDFTAIKAANAEPW